MTSQTATVDLADDMLFGNDTAEMETPSVLYDYFVRTPQFDKFLGRDKPLSIACAKKGVGKSAVLRYLEYTLCQGGEDVVCSVSGKDLVRYFAQLTHQPDNPTMLISSWELAICREINRTIGTTIHLALSDDDITLTELAEITGSKPRNAVSAFVDRIKIKYAERTKCLPADDLALLERYASNKNVCIWLLVDDIDATFIYNPQNALALSTFLSACRGLVNQVPGLFVRACMRSDVWTMIKTKDEALDKVEQYLFSIAWDREEETREILAKRISAYLLRRGIIHSIEPSRSYEYIERVFEKDIPWGKDGQTRPPHVVVHTLSMGRPRWAIKMCKGAAARATTARSPRIGLSHINAALAEYGNGRLDDLYREHQHQCPQIAEVVQAFARGPNKYDYDELVIAIKNRILQRPGGIVIDGNPETVPQLIARFLYRIGFITARLDLDVGRYQHIDFDHNPYVFVAATNSGSQYVWEIHPAYRHPLELLSDKESGRRRPYR